MNEGNEGKESLIKRLLHLPLHKVGRVVPPPETSTTAVTPDVQPQKEQLIRVKNEGSVKDPR